MEKQLERRPDVEPRLMERVVEEIQRRLREEKALMETLPHVLKYADLPWLQNAQRFGKCYTGAGITNRLSRIPIFTFSASEQMLGPGEKSGKHRHYMEAVFYVVEGEGYEIHDDVKYDWQAGDVVCVPTYCVHQHFNLNAKGPARLFYSVPHAFELMGLSQRDQLETHVNYQPPAEARLIRDLQGSLRGYHTSDDLGLKLGADIEFQSMMEAKQTQALEEEIKTTYDRYLKTLVEETGWRRTISHVVKARDLLWENTRMGRVRYFVSPYNPSALLLYDCFIQEIPPGGRSGKHRHVSEEIHKIIFGRGYDIQDEKRYDWESEDIVAIPINTVHQHFNADTQRPAMFVAFQSRLYHYVGHGGIEHLEDAPS